MPISWEWLLFKDFFLGGGELLREKHNIQLKGDKTNPEVSISVHNPVLKKGIARSSKKSQGWRQWFISSLLTDAGLVYFLLYWFLPPLVEIDFWLGAHKLNRSWTAFLLNPPGL